MVFKELCLNLINDIGEPGDYVVKLSYGYKSETGRTTYEIVSFNGDELCWLNDWYEGEDWAYYDEIIKFDDLIKVYNMSKKR